MFPAMLPACGSGGGGGDAGADLSTTTGGDMSGGGGDMASANTLDVAWSLITANISGGANNGFQVDCDKAGVTQLQFTAVDQNSKTMKTSMAPCPAGMNGGMATIGVPGQGPFTVWGVAVGKPMSAGEHIKDVVPGSTPSLRIYVDGCDQPVCM